MIYQSASQRRPGMVLLVVMAMLALFATVGLSFVFFADASAVAANLGKQSLLKSEPDVEPEVLAAYALSQMLYDTDNIFSALRGWSMANTLYGHNPGALNFTPYNGAGRDSYMPTGTNDPIYGVPLFRMINNQWHFDPSIPNVPGDPTNFAMRPEHYGVAAAIRPDGATQAGTTVTIITAGPHGLTVGSPVNISGVGVAGYNGAFTVSAVVSPTGFRYTAATAGLPQSGYGTAGPAAFRYVGGANAPWTAYDTNNLFLAQVQADGAVLMPSFHRPWLSPGATNDPSGKAKYLTLRPHGSWHPGFFNLPMGSEVDSSGMQFDVRNLDFGPGRLTSTGYQNNDSIWIDMGAPVMTAPNGRKYKMLVAPLIMDLSNRLHLWAHGNRRGGTVNAPIHVSNQGMGAPEVNINLRMPRVSAVIKPLDTSGPVANTGASAAGVTVTINTTTPHGFVAGDRVVVSGVLAAGYNGTFTVLPNPTANAFRYTNAVKGLPRSGYGTVVNAEFQELLNYRYGGAAGTTASVASGAMTGFPNNRGGLYGTTIDVDALSPTVPLPAKPAITDTGAGSHPLHFTFTTSTVNPPPAKSKGLVPGANQTINMQATTGIGYGGFHWTIYPGMQLNIIDPTTPPASGRNETVTVVSVNHTQKTIVVENLAFPHAITPPLQIKFGSDTQNFPAYPFGWNNLTGGAPLTEVTNNPLKLDLFNPSLAAAPNTNTLPSAMWMEAILRHRGTNGPATTSEPFRRMPDVFSSVNVRSMLTTINQHLDRVGSVPGLPFDFSTPGHYQLNSAGLPQLVSTALPNPGLAGPNYGMPYPLSTTKSNFGPDWRSKLGNHLRVDLNRFLSDYPPAAATGLIPGNAATTPFMRAQIDRQNLARDIYNALVRVTGAQDPNDTSVTVNSGSQEYQAAKWLAQLAVNIVDYIDADDICTPFQWNTRTTTVDDWVFGVELPKLVMNEIYTQYQGTGPIAGNVGNTDVWIELLNPSMNAGTAFPLDNGAAKLVQGTSNNPIYEIEIHAANAALTTALAGANNSLGAAPGAPLVPALGAAPNNWGTTLTGPTRQVLPLNGASNGSQIVATIAPAAAPGATKAGAIITFKTTAAHNMGVGQPVIIAGVGDPGYNGRFVIATAPTTTTFTVNAGAGALPNSGGGTASAWSNTGFYVVGPRAPVFNGTGRDPSLPATYTSPQMSVPAPITAGVPIASATEAGTTATITTTVVHGLSVGDFVTINGVTPVGYDGTFLVTSVPTTTTFTYTTVAGLPAGTIGAGATARIATSRVSVLLRRLANPYRAASTVPGANYNPFITVDYVHNVRSAPGGGPVSGGQANGFRSVGRRQPYTASTPQVVDQTTTVGGQPNNTFFTHNVPRDTPFDWLVHLDRPLVNPLELLHVSGVRPHELTQKFKNSAGMFQHYAPWASVVGVGTTATDQGAMLYRALESFGTANRMAGTIVGGPHHGAVNLNTIMAPEVFVGIGDPQDAHRPNPLFTKAGLDTVFNNLVASRNNNAAVTPISEGNPVQPLSASSLSKTIFRNGQGTTTPLFQVGTSSNHPYLQASFMQKVYNNTTTTSNAFAIWWTVGFFEVLEANTTQDWIAGTVYTANDIVRFPAGSSTTFRCMPLPPVAPPPATPSPPPVAPPGTYWLYFPLDVYPQRLGAEVGRDQNRHVRHRFFAIVDRSAMELARMTSGNLGFNANLAVPQKLPMSYAANSVSVMGGTTAAWNATTQYYPGDTVSSGGAAFICLQRNTNTLTTNRLVWQRAIQPGMLLEVGVAPNSEVVAVHTHAAWNAATAYPNGSFVLFNGDIYRCNMANTGQSPPGGPWQANFFEADFMMDHATGSPIVVRGNPGPRSRYNPRLDKNVVLHFSVIQ